MLPCWRAPPIHDGDDARRVHADRSVPGDPLGASALKFFPASVLGAEGHFGDRRRAAEGHAVGAVGGVSEEDFADYAKIGVRTFGLGSSLFKPGMSAAEVGSKGGRRGHGLGPGFRGGVSMAEQRRKHFFGRRLPARRGADLRSGQRQLFWFDIVGKKLLEKTVPGRSDASSTTLPTWPARSRRSTRTAS